MRVTFITTVHHNVGDDFVRDGIQFLLRQCEPDEKFEFAAVHKHRPMTSRYGFARLGRLDKSGAWDKRLPLQLTRDKILEADLVVQSGAPVYWCHDNVNAHCWDNEWYEPLILRRLAQNKKAKLLNIAGGSCQKYYSCGSDVCAACLNYIRDFFDRSALTTLRDQLAADILRRVQVNAPVLPCTSLFAPNENGATAAAGEYAVMNYMENAGHYTFGQAIDSERWPAVFRQVYAELKKEMPVLLVCHTRKERESARSIDPRARIFFSANYKDYLPVYARASFGIVNRVHAALVLAGYGKPALVVSNDTRSRMMDEIACPRFFVNETTSELLLAQARRMATEAKEFAEKMRCIKETTLRAYTQLLSPFVCVK